MNIKTHIKAGPTIDDEGEPPGAEGEPPPGG